MSSLEEKKAARWGEENTTPLRFENVEWFSIENVPAFTLTGIVDLFLVRLADLRAGRGRRQEIRSVESAIAILEYVSPLFCSTHFSEAACVHIASMVLTLANKRRTVFDALDTAPLIDFIRPYARLA
jgi:hypothetical protein